MKGSITITKALKVDKVVTVKATIFKYILLKWYIQSLDRVKWREFRILKIFITTRSNPEHSVSEIFNGQCQLNGTIDGIFPGGKTEFRFLMYIFKFNLAFSLADLGQKKLLSYVVKHILLKSILFHSLNLLNFVDISVFDVKTALDIAKLAILEQLEWQVFLPLPNHGVGLIRTFSSEKFSSILQNLKCQLCDMVIYFQCWVLRPILSAQNQPKQNFWDFLGLFDSVQIASQPAITCSKLTIETLEQGVKYVQSYGQIWPN